jgi:hypothetical protein
MVHPIAYQRLMAMSKKQDPSTLEQWRTTVVMAVAPPTPHLRSLQNSNSQQSNSNASSSLGPIFVFFFIFAVVCVFAAMIRRCMSQQRSQPATGTARSTANGTVTANTTGPRPHPSRTTGSTTNGNVQEQPERHVNAHLDIELSSKGMDRQQIERQLVTRHYLDEEENASHKECAICLSSFKKGEEVAQSVNSECTHLFHTECIVDWLVTQPACPECRREFLTSPDP